MQKKLTNKVCLLLLLITYFAAAYTVMNYYGITCVFWEFLKIPCPGCGMTRALKSLLKLDFYGAIRYNIGIFFMPYVFMYLFLDFKHKIHKLLLIASAIIIFINWILKLILFL